MNGPRLLERITRVTPFGLRFRDDATGRSVGDGLTVMVRAAGGTRQVTATPNRTGVFVARDLPGLRDVEFGHGHDPTGDGVGESWADIAPAPFVVEVVDPRRRFLPISFEVTAPARGVARPACLQAASAHAVPLFSSPARTIPPGMGAVRAELRDAADRPVAAALLEVVHATDGQRLGRGLSDQEGRVSVSVVYPEPPSSPGSPPQAGEPLARATWPVELRVAATFPERPDRPPESELPGRALRDPVTPPDLCSVLHQPTARLLATLSPPVPLPSLQLAFGTDLVARSTGRSELVVTPI